jgi:transcriptional regulator of met regulon
MRHSRPVKFLCNEGLPAFTFWRLPKFSKFKKNRKKPFWQEARLTRCNLLMKSSGRDAPREEGFPAYSFWWHLWPIEIAQI